MLKIAILHASYMLFKRILHSVLLFEVWRPSFHLQSPAPFNNIFRVSLCRHEYFKTIA